MQQRIVNLWKSAIGKIIIIAGSVVGICLMCGVVGSLLPSPPSDAKPTVENAVIQTSAVQTVFAQAALTQRPSSTITPTVTSAPTFTDVPSDEYVFVATTRFQSLQEATAELAEIHSQFAGDPSLSQNNDWYFHATATLLRVVAGATELASMNNYPSQYSNFHQQMVGLAAEVHPLEANYTAALDNQDIEALNRATSNLGNMITYLNQASVDLNTLKPTATALPTQPVPPTATFVFIQPTAASTTGFDNNRDGKVTCADFQTHSAAQQAYNAGYTNLDGNDNDGLACETLP